MGMSDMYDTIRLPGAAPSGSLPKGAVFVADDITVPAKASNEEQV